MSALTNKPHPVLHRVGFICSPFFGETGIGAVLLLKVSDTAANHLLNLPVLVRPSYSAI